MALQKRERVIYFLTSLEKGKNKGDSRKPNHQDSEANFEDYGLISNGNSKISSNANSRKESENTNSEYLSNQVTSDNNKNNSKKISHIKSTKEENKSVYYNYNELPVHPAKFTDSDNSEDEGMEDYKVGGYHPVHVG
jgi:hypothetical protein